MERKYVPVGEGEREKIEIRSRAPNLPYPEIADLMRQGLDVFISNLPTRSAYYAKQRLSELLQKRVNAWPAKFEGLPGYLFSTRSEEEIAGRRKVAKYP